MHITVCSLSRLSETQRACKARRLVTLISDAGRVERPEGIAEAEHLMLRFHDITAPQEGFTPPTAQHVEDYLAFIRSWDRTAPLLVHCWAGISRSTAAAYIAVCALSPHRDEAEIARALRAAAPSATPNALFVSLADDILQREGRMIEAIRAIGRGEEAFEGTPFTLHLDVSP